MMAQKNIAIVSIAVAVMGAGSGPKDCDPQEVVKRVCARYIEPLPFTSCFTNYNRADDTGYGKKATDVVDSKLLDSIVQGDKTANDLPEALKNDLTTLRPGAYDRYQRIFEAVQRAYQKLVDQMPEPDRTYYTNRLSNYDKTSSSFMTSLSSAISDGPNAEYDDNQEGFIVLPLLLNAQGMSDVEIEMILAHEFGHAIDPDRERKSFPVPKLANSSTRACFNKTYEGKGDVKKYRDEDFADFMASQVSSVLIEEGKDDAARRARALNWAYFFCKADPSDSPILSALAIFSKNETHDDSDEHRTNSERISYLMNNREMMNRIGCKSTSPCSLWQNQKH